MNVAVAFITELLYIRLAYTHTHTYTLRIKYPYVFDSVLVFARKIEMRNVI